jgi:hypothetical protein
MPPCLVLTYHRTILTMGGVHIVAHRISSLEDTQSMLVTSYYDLPSRAQKHRLTANSAGGIRHAYMNEFNLILKNT